MPHAPLAPSSPLVPQQCSVICVHHSLHYGSNILMTTTTTQPAGHIHSYTHHSCPTVMHGRVFLYTVTLLPCTTNMQGETDSTATTPPEGGLRETSTAATVVPCFACIAQDVHMKLTFCNKHSNNGHVQLTGVSQVSASQST